MIVSKDKLIQYSIPEDWYFERRIGDGNPISRDAYFNANPSFIENKKGIYCAIGTDELGYELEMYNGVNWTIVMPDTSYSLIITNNGLTALTNVRQGITQLRFSGIKIIDKTIIDPEIPIVEWTDTTFTGAGNVVFSVGTLGSPHEDSSQLSQILKWRLNSSSGGLQYILTLPASGFGSQSDKNADTWKIGAIGLYVKDPNDQTTDVLFAVATLPELITKHASTVEVVGNTIKLYFNTILTNLGIVSNLDVLPDANVSLPEVSNETLLNYPINIEKDPYNCYIVDNLYGTNMPALAVKRAYNFPTEEGGLDYNEWVWLQPNDNFIMVDESAFADGVKNYSFVYWDTTINKYKLAEGQIGSSETNSKAPIGVRIGNSIVFSGTITNATTSYTYSTELKSGGASYAIGDELLLPVSGSLTIKVLVTATNSSGAITAVNMKGPSAGNIAISNPVIISAIYSPDSQLPRNGTGARIEVKATELQDTVWNFPASYLNKPVYCDKGTNAGKVTTTETDCMVGWVIASNSIKLGLDLRNEATTSQYGTVQYATASQVADTYNPNNVGISTIRVPCIKDLKDNYLQTSLPYYGVGSSLTNPIQVNSFVKFNKTLLGKSTNTPDETIAGQIDFYGKSFRAWYQDLAEYYEADKYYEPGTLITFGKGLKEISIATTECDGVISTNPGYELGDKKSNMHLPVTLVGRVPVLFDGNCMPKKSDKIYLSKIKPGCASTVPNGKCLGKIIEDVIGTKKLIECVVRIDF